MQTRSSPSVSTLHSLARQAGLQPSAFGCLSKPQLFQRLKDQWNLERLQRAQSRSVKRKTAEKEIGAVACRAWMHGRRATRRSSSGSACANASVPPQPNKRQKLNTIDPILLTEIGPHKFKFIRPNGFEVMYDLESLVDFFLKTGDFHEPETRIAFSDQDLQRIDQLAKEAKLDKPSVLHAKHHPEIYKEARFERDALLGVERCAGELVTDMMQVVERCDDPEEGEMKLVVTLFPLFTDMYKQMEGTDKEFAEQSLHHFKLFIRGPPNRPTRDPFGFLPIVLSFLEDLRGGKADFLL